MPEAKPTEAEIQALLAHAEATRGKPSRGLWIAAIVVSIVCVVALAYGLVMYWDAPPTSTTVKPTAATDGSGFGLGLVIGIGAGILIGSVLAIRRRQP